jgi:DNA-binding response OmpR family regulator
MGMNKKIFLIEDDATILFGLSAKMSNEGFSIVPNDGTGEIKDVWVKINSERPDFIVLDLIVPGFDGFDLLRKIKQDPVISVIPVFVFTNMSDTDTKLKCDEAGADYFFIKTEFNIDEFVDKVNVIIKNLEKVK